MIAKDMVNAVIPALDIDDDIARASTLMDDLRVSVLPVLQGASFRGFIREESLYDDLFDKPTLGEYPLQSANCIVRQDQHFYEVIKVASESQDGIVAVVENDDTFVGVITPEEIIRAFAGTTAVQSPGSIIEITLNRIDYSLTEITRLIESENAQVIGCFLISKIEDNSKINVTLKLNKKEVSHVVATLRRFNYKIDRIIQEENLISYEKERLDALMKYLSI